MEFLPIGARRRQLMSAAAATLMLVSGCMSANDAAQVAVGAEPTPVATTAPLALPVELSEPSGEAAAETPQTTDPVPEPTPTTVAAAPAQATTVTPEPTATPIESSPSTAEAQPEPTVTAAAVAEPTVPAATAVPAAAEPAATSVPVPTPAPTLSPAAPSGATIALGDFDVVNLVTGTSQNIADLAPRGQTMLWFWAPH